MYLWGCTPPCLPSVSLACHSVDPATSPSLSAAAACLGLVLAYLLPSCLPALFSSSSRPGTCQTNASELWMGLRASGVWEGLRAPLLPYSPQEASGVRTVCLCDA